MILVVIGRKERIKENSTFILYESIENTKIRCKIKIASNGG